MQDSEKLKTILARLADPTTADAARLEARDFLNTVSPEDLVHMERELVAAGMQPDKIQVLCPSHQAAAAGQAADLRGSLADDHPIAVLMEEHQVFLGRLVTLEKLIEGEEYGTQQQQDLADIAEVAEQLIAGEPHHQREEQVLFPRMVAAGFAGPPTMMEREHVQLRAAKHKTLELARKMLGGEEGHWSELRQTARTLLASLRDHITKEDNILYPMALQALPTQSWVEMQPEFDAVGYLDPA